MKTTYTVKFIYYRYHAGEKENDYVNGEVKELSLERAREIARDINNSRYETICHAKQSTKAIETYIGDGYFAGTPRIFEVTERLIL